MISGVAPERIPFEELIEGGEPAILKGVVAHWPLVARGHESARSAADYLKRFCSVRPATVYEGAPSIAGRFFYDEKFTGMNFTVHRMPLADCLDRVLATRGDGQAPSFYAGSTDVDTFLPGLRAENDLVLDRATSREQGPVVSMWIGNRTTACAHYDQSHNMACNLVGHRRFTLFPPEQIHNLYPGPLDPTPGGQVVSVVNFREPDFERFPRFHDALAAGQVAELEPGDLLFYPALWWHHVEALDAFNVMMNYWWHPSPAYLDSPHTSLLHALLSLRDRGNAEKEAWREIFDFYVFGDAANAGRHLPDQARGYLAPMDENRARRLRSLLLSRLNR